MAEARTTDPATVARAFERFAASGYAWGKFPDGLYRPLTFAFGFIAHYDRGGFHAARFRELDDLVETLQTMVAPTPWASTQVEIALRDTVVRCDLLAMAVIERDSELERAERATLARLQAKYAEAK